MRPVAFTTLRALGEAMQHWHRSMHDPVYAVGSFYFAGDEYPDAEVVVAARDSLQADLAAPCPSWNRRDLKELAAIVAALNLKIDP